VAQMVVRLPSPEFKPQYHKKKKKEIVINSKGIILATATNPESRGFNKCLFLAYTKSNQNISLYSWTQATFVTLLSSMSWEFSLFSC
jgi:hypothetical protein